MDKTSKKVTKDPRRVEQGKKSYETRMNRLKEKILENNQPPTSSTSSPTCDPTSFTSSSTCDPKPSTSSSTYDLTPVYGVGMLAVLAIVICVFFSYNTSQAKNKKQDNDHSAAQHEQKKQDQPPKPRYIL